MPGWSPKNASTLSSVASPQSAHLTAYDITLPKSPSVAMSNARRFSPPPDAGPGSSLPLDSPLDTSNGKITSQLGTIPRARRSGKGSGTESHACVCPEAFYVMPSLASAAANASYSRGVATSAKRFDGVGDNSSPGPIYFPAAAPTSKGGPWGPPPPRATASTRRRMVDATSTAEHKAQEALARIERRSASPATASLNATRSGSRPPSRCTFGQRTASASRPATSNAPLSYSGSTVLSGSSATSGAGSGRGKTTRLPGGYMSTCPRRTMPNGFDIDESTPGPGHYNRPADATPVPRAGAYMGKRLRRPQPSTPGPGSYDIRAAEALLRRPRR